MSIKTICVFCGARTGNIPTIEQLVYQMGQEMAKRQISIVCGGSDCGLMRAITNAALEEHGRVIGVFPNILKGVEIPHPRLSAFIPTLCLPSRKQKMMDMSDAFLILPGGYGTLDELFEIIVLRRLNANQKPILLWNYEGFWDPMLQQIERMVKTEYIGQEESHLLNVFNQLDQFQKILDLFSKGNVCN